MVVRLAQVDQKGEFADYQAETEITCKAVAHSRLYVSAEGLVFPCCWTGALYPPGRPSADAYQRLRLAFTHIRAFLNADR